MSPQPFISFTQICIGGENMGKFRVYGEIKKCCKSLSYSTLLFVETSASWYNSYPEPGSNRHGLPHWCLRPARLPIPPSGLDTTQLDSQLKAGAKVIHFFEMTKVSYKKLKNICKYQLLCVSSRHKI